jgi:hypothetical protein
MVLSKCVFLRRFPNLFHTHFERCLQKCIIQTNLSIRERHNRRKSCKILISGIINITKFRIFIMLMCRALEDSNIELDFWFPQRWDFTLPKLVVGKDGEKSRKRSSSDGSEKMERVGDR